MDFSAFERFAQNLDGASVELGEFVEEQDAVVRQRDFTRLRVTAAADQRDSRYRVMWRLERTLAPVLRVYLLSADRANAGAAPGSGSDRAPAERQLRALRQRR